MSYKIGFAGTDGRTLVSALTVQEGHHAEEFSGVVVRGTSGMPEVCRRMDQRVRFIPTEDNSVDAYTKAVIRALDRQELDIVVPMPEDLQIQGFVNELIAARWHRRVIGLTREGSVLESDKVIGKAICMEASIPVADEWCVVYARDFLEVRGVCLDFIHRYGGAVLKYPYPAAGKGSRIIRNTWEIKDVWQTLYKDYRKDYAKICGDEADRRWPLLIESLMSGVEISFTVLVDGDGHWQFFPTAMDYPESFAGPVSKDNRITGGMASISPHPFETPELMEMAGERIIRPLVSAMRARGILRPCFLYPGAFVSFDSHMHPRAIRLCEINIRPPEPEFQTMIKLVRNLGALLQAAVENRLHEVKPEIRQDQISLSVALVVGPGGPNGQKGYPDRYTNKEEIFVDLEYLAKHNIQFIPSGMGYSDSNGKLFSDGGRVAYLAGNAPVRQGQTRGAAAVGLSERLFRAYDQGRVRLIPREDPAGNRFRIRRDAGLHFVLADDLLNTSLP